MLLSGCVAHRTDKAMYGSAYFASGRHSAQTRWLSKTPEASSVRARMIAKAIAGVRGRVEARESNRTIRVVHSYEDHSKGDVACGHEPISKSEILPRTSWSALAAEYNHLSDSAKPSNVYLSGGGRYRPES